MERMTRNGLLILLAVLTAFALPLCPKNSAHAQMIGPQIPGALPPEFWSGSTAFIQYNPVDGTTNIVYPDYDAGILDPDVGLWTHPYGWINTGIRTDEELELFSFFPVFRHGSPSSLGGFLYLDNAYIYNVPDAFGNGGTIASMYAPAIVSGMNEHGIRSMPRYYQMVITGNLASGYIINWYYYFQDAPGVLYPLGPGDPDADPPIPPDQIPPLTLLWLTEGLGSTNPNITWDPDTNTAYLAPGMVIHNLTHQWNPVTGLWDIPIGPEPIPGVGLGYAPPGVSLQFAFGPQDQLTWLNGGVIPVFSGTIAGWDAFTGGWVQAGDLFINMRAPGGRRTFEGDSRTLIVSEGSVAIQNRGNLEIYDSRIELRGPRMFGSRIGIQHGYLRVPVALGTTTGTPPITFYTHAGYSYPFMGLEESVRLFNTQIGRADGWSTDPVTGQMDMSRIPFDDGRGSPIRTYTDLWADRVLTSDGVNGRITVGQNVVLARNPIGSIGKYPHRDPNHTKEHDAQYTIYNLWELDAPDFGIYAAPDLGDYDFLGRDYAYFISAGTLINFNPYYSSWWQPGFMSTISGEYGYVLGGTARSIEDQIQLNDNSWIFANIAGIAFGNTQGNMYIGDSAIRVFIDKSSGIYSAGLGITDRYSTTDIWVAVIPPDNAANHKMIDSILYSGYGYSGSFHEIHVDGKVITGAPSRAGVRLYFDDAVLYNPNAPADTSGLQRVYYYDSDDPDSDLWGRVFYTRETASKFVAFNGQPNRRFWLELPGGQDPVPLTYYDYAAQRWMLDPHAPTVRVRGAYGNEPYPYFAAFDVSFGTGIDIVGTSWVWEGRRLTPAGIISFTSAPWASYLGPTVREITVLKDDALVTGGTVNVTRLLNWYAGWDPFNPRIPSINDISGAAMYFGTGAHVAKVLIGENKDVKNLSDVLFVGTTDDLLR
jgi:hypothetical protein